MFEWNPLGTLQASVLYLELRKRNPSWKQGTSPHTEIRNQRLLNSRGRMKGRLALKPNRCPSVLEQRTLYPGDPNGKNDAFDLVCGTSVVDLRSGIAKKQSPYFFSAAGARSDHRTHSAGWLRFWRWKQSFKARPSFRNDKANALRQQQKRQQPATKTYRVSSEGHSR